MSSARSLVAPFLILSLLLIGCVDDPTDVGLGLVDVQAGAPQTVSIDASAFELADDADITGGYLGVNSNFQTVPQGANRILAGVVDDPSLGLIEATASVNFIPAVIVGDEFRDGTVSTVNLILILDYVYGDTLSPVTLSLSEIEDSWTSVGVRADTVIVAGSEITSFIVDPGQSIVSVDLPDAWVAANDERLRSESLTELLNGFQISPVSGNAVLGFDRETSLFQISVPGDTLRMGFEKLVTSISKNDLPVPAEYLLLQDGLDVASITLDMDSEQLNNSSVHNAIFRVETGNPELITPANFSRPKVSNLDLIAVTGIEESRILLGSTEIDDEGRVSISSSDLNLAMQNTARGIGDLVRFELAVRIDQHSLDYIFFKRHLMAGGPTMLVTITEVN